MPFVSRDALLAFVLMVSLSLQASAEEREGVSAGGNPMATKYQWAISQALDASTGNSSESEAAK